MEKALVRCLVVIVILILMVIVIVIVVVVAHGNNRRVVVKATTSRNGCLALAGLAVVVVRSAATVDHGSVETAELELGGRLGRVRVENQGWERAQAEGGYLTAGEVTDVASVSGFGQKPMAAVGRPA